MDSQQNPPLSLKYDAHRPSGEDFGLSAVNDLSPGVHHSESAGLAPVLACVSPEAKPRLTATAANMMIVFALGWMIPPETRLASCCPSTLFPHHHCLIKS